MPLGCIALDFISPCPDFKVTSHFLDLSGMSPKGSFALAVALVRRLLYILLLVCLTFNAFVSGHPKKVPRLSPAGSHVSYVRTPRYVA